MAVTPQEVKKLRDRTGAGMLDCKNALVKSGGDFAAAEKVLKEQGLASADKRVGRATNNGSVFARIEDARAVMVELTCETDFVAKNQVFQSAGEKIAAAFSSSDSPESGADLDIMVKEAIAVLKENMILGQKVHWNVAGNEAVGHYSHNNGQIGVLVKLTCDSPETAGKQEVKELAFDLALHAAAFNPAYLNRDAVDSGHITEQQDIFAAQAAKLGDKPEKVLQSIAQGKLNKHLQQICFVEQGFVKEEKKTVKQVIAEAAKSAGGTVELTDYAHIAVGQNQ